MTGKSRTTAERLRAAAGEAIRAEGREDWQGVDAAWARYRLVRDAGRDPDELVEESLALSRLAIALASER